MRSKYLLAAALALGIAVRPAGAQDEGVMDFSAYLRATQPDENLDKALATGFGARWGVYLKKNIAFEVEMAQVERAKDNYILMRPISARLTYHQPLTERWKLIGGAGYVRQTIDPPGRGKEFADDGWTGILSLERKLDNHRSIRLDGVFERHHTPVNETQANRIDDTHASIQLGLVWRFRQKEQAAPAPAPMPAPPPPADTDGDGVIDANDRCAGTPAGTRVDAGGCPVPVDSDGDGVMDNNDRCANTPAGTRVDASGCPVPVDSDGDGVMDNADRCAGTPAGTRVDANGCAVPVDTDGDGVMDNVDACPNTARGTVVDARGCARIFEEGRTTLVLEGVTFNSGSATLTAAAQAVLDNMATLLNGAPDVNVEVQGHTDNTGSVAVNTRLSGQRAEAVRAYLESKGVAGSRLTAKGYGPTTPVADNATAAGRAQNRRVELKRTN